MDVEDESLVQMFGALYDDAVYSFRQFLQLNRWKKKQEESLVTDQVAIKTTSSTSSPFNHSVVAPAVKSTSQYPRMAHSQDIIDAPHHIVPGETSFVVPAANVLPNNSQGDFSLTFWILLTEDSMGERRLILLRGNLQEFNPLVSLNANERTIEIIITKQTLRRQGNTSPSTDSERLPSKSPVPLHRWTHVAIVSEAAQLRLYMNGILDAQRTNYSGIYRKVSQSRNPIYVGYNEKSLPAGFPVKNGIEGCLAKVRYHSRALSPIHVRVDCEKGPPSSTTAQIVDNHCYQMHLLLWLSANTPLGLKMMSNKKWIELLLSVLREGTYRVKQCAVRILRILIPNVDPKVLANLFVCMQDAGSKSHGAKVVETLLDFIGHSIWPEVSTDKNVIENLLMTQQAITTTRPQLQLCEYGTLALENTNNSYTIGSEAISLIKQMYNSSLWERDVWHNLVDAVNGFKKCVAEFDPIADTEAQLTDSCRRGWAALAVLGGHFDNLRIGGKVSLSHTNLTATILSLESDANTCSAGMLTPAVRIAMVETHANAQVDDLVTAPGQHQAVRAVRMSTEELRIIDDTNLVCETKDFGGVTNALLDMLHELFQSKVFQVILCKDSADSDAKKFTVPHDVDYGTEVFDSALGPSQK